jgi:hypothetical protein
MDGPSGGRGKWSKDGVPKKGWECVNVEDLGEPSARCEMCESSEIRYVHYMENPRYDGTLACGAICAGHMEEDLYGADHRDKVMRSSAGKRKRFPHRKGWRVSQKGNPVFKDGVFIVTAFLHGRHWRASVHNSFVNKTQFTRESFATKEEAQMAAYDTLTLLKSTAKQVVVPYSAGS